MLIVLKASIPFLFDFAELTTFCQPPGGLYAARVRT